jgi:hypothetical protein
MMAKCSFEYLHIQQTAQKNAKTVGMTRQTNEESIFQLPDAHATICFGTKTHQLATGTEKTNKIEYTRSTMEIDHRDRSSDDSRHFSLSVSFHTRKIVFS